MSNKVKIVIMKVITIVMFINGLFTLWAAFTGDYSIIDQEADPKSVMMILIFFGVIFFGGGIFTLIKLKKLKVNK